MEFSQEKIKEAFDKADPRVRAILLDTWITEDVSLIGKKAGLRIDKIDDLIKIVGYVILNLIPLSKLIDIIQEETGLDEEKATTLTEKIDQFIFVKIRQKIRGNDENDVIKSENETEIENLGPEDIRDSLIKDIEDHAGETSEPKEGESFSDMFNNSKTTVLDDKKVDLYRENF